MVGKVARVSPVAGFTTAYSVMSTPISYMSGGSALHATQALGGVHRKRLTLEERRTLDRLPDHDDDADQDHRNAEDEHEPEAADVGPAPVIRVRAVDQRGDEQDRKDYTADEREQEGEEQIPRRVEPLLAEV